jgi:hypothetical protein
MAFDFHPTKVNVWMKGQFAGSINEPQFVSTFLKTWLGDHPPTDELKKAMLGQKG